MEIRNTSTVAASPDATVALLLLTCIPGAAIGPPGSHPAGIAVKLGPMMRLTRGDADLRGRAAGIR